MTPKEKAKELVEKFIAPTKVYHEHLGWVNYLDSAKECALIAVEELIKQQSRWNNGSFYPSNYWTEVKEEMEKIDKL